MKTPVFVLVGLFLWAAMRSVCALNDSWLDDDRAWLRGQIAEMQGQLNYLNSLKAASDIATVNIAAGTAGPGDYAAVAQWKAAKFTNNPGKIRNQLNQAQQALAKVEGRIHKLGTTKPPQNWGFTPPGNVHKGSPSHSGGGESHHQGGGGGEDHHKGQDPTGQNPTGSMGSEDHHHGADGTDLGAQRQYQTKQSGMMMKQQNAMRQKQHNAMLQKQQNVMRQKQQNAMRQKQQQMHMKNASLQKKQQQQMMMKNAALRNKQQQQMHMKRAAAQRSQVQRQLRKPKKNQYSY
ncbi:MAG TPA: hypothetical protein VJ063_10945 [Verrucomicrobiae bacterium]|nr:hypothetical protein [Verrucomicrobiae bacterium]